MHDLTVFAAGLVAGGGMVAHYVLQEWAVSRMTDLIISAIGLGICVAGIAYLILKGGSDDD